MVWKKKESKRLPEEVSVFADPLPLASLRGHKKRNGFCSVDVLRLLWFLFLFIFAPPDMPLILTVDRHTQRLLHSPMNSGCFRRIFKRSNMNSKIHLMVYVGEGEDRIEGPSEEICNLVCKCSSSSSPPSLCVSLFPPSEGHDERRQQQHHHRRRPRFPK